MRALLLLAALLAGCGSTATCKCQDGFTCVFFASETVPSCRPACPSDGGACPNGGGCSCGSSCLGCENCMMVCR